VDPEVRVGVASEVVAEERHSDRKKYTKWYNTLAHCFRTRWKRTGVGYEWVRVGAVGEVLSS
jgi:hypothetical protein